MWRNAMYVGFWIVVAAGCGGGSGDGNTIPAIPQVASSTKVQGEVAPAQGLPPAEEPTDAILLQLLQRCAVNIGSGETQLLNGAVLSQFHGEIIQWSLVLYEQGIATDGRLIGRDMPVRFVGAGTTPDLTGSRINVLEAISAPGLPSFNAFALENLVVMLDPLLNALMEGAAYWDRLLEQSGENEDLVDPAELVGGLGTIFQANAAGQFGAVVPQSEVLYRVSSRPFGFEAYWGAVAYVLFHELGHSNLEHVLFQCLVREGVDQALADAGITPTQPQLDALKLALTALSRGVETQADIYAATISERAGFSSNGAAVFVLGILSLKLVSGACDPFQGDDAAFESCILGSSPEDDHPPLDVRAEIASKVIDEGQDLTPLLDILDALSLG